MAIKYLEERGRGDLQGGIFGYEGFDSRRLISEMLGLKRYWEALVRMFEHGVLGLDEKGRILSVPSLTAASDREAIQETLSEIKQARLPEAYRTVTYRRSPGPPLGRLARRLGSARGT